MCSTQENLHALTSTEGYFHSKLVDFDVLSRGPMRCELCQLIRRISRLGINWHESFSDQEFRWFAVEGTRSPQDDAVTGHSSSPFSKNRFSQFKVKGPQSFFTTIDLYVFAHEGKLDGSF